MVNGFLVLLLPFSRWGLFICFVRLGGSPMLRSDLLLAYFSL